VTKTEKEFGSVSTAMPHLKHIYALIVVLSLALPPKIVAGKSSWRKEVAARLDDQDYTTTSPLIGVITQPHRHKHHKDEQSISGPLVSWVESAGGRVVPIEYDAPWHVLEEKFSALNGLVLPVSLGSNK